MGKITLQDKPLFVDNEKVETSIRQSLLTQANKSLDLAHKRTDIANKAKQIKLSQDHKTGKGAADYRMTALIPMQIWNRMRQKFGDNWYKDKKLFREFIERDGNEMWLTVPKSEI